MDWFTTALDLAGVGLPSDRMIDGVSLKNVLAGGKEFDRLKLSFRGDVLAVYDNRYLEAVLDCLYQKMNYTFWFKKQLF